MNRTAALAKNTALIAISKVSTQLVMFFMLPLYTTVLSTSDYGAVDLIITYGGLFAPLIMLNIQQSVFRHLIDARSDKEMQHKVITNAIEITIGVSLMVALLYCIANIFVDIPFAASMAFYFAAFIVGDLVLQVARGLGQTKAFAITGIVQGLLTVALNIVFMLPLQMGANGMLLGMGLGLLLPATVLAAMIGVHHSIKRSARDRVTKKQLLAFSIPLIPNTISWWVFNASDRTIISIVLGVAANGIYAVSNKFSNIANGFSSIFYTSWSESAALAINDSDRDTFFSSIANTTLRTFGTFGILIMSFTPIVFPLLVDEKYNEALLYLPILVLGTVFNTVVSFYSAIYVAKKLTKKVMSTSISAAIINLGINMTLIWSVGIWAAAISTAAAYGIMAVYRHHDMKKYVTIKYDLRVLATLTTGYVLVATLYYLNSPVGNIINIMIATIFAAYFNHSLVATLSKKMIKKA